MAVAIFWFRNDLRLADNPALTEATRQYDRVVPVYIHEPDASVPWAAGAASRWWLHHSLASLAHELDAAGSRLVLRSGSALEVLAQLCTELDAAHVFWNRRYEPALSECDANIKERLADTGISCTSGNGALLFEPWTIATQAGKPYRVFTPFWRSCTALGLDVSPLPPPRRLSAVSEELHSVPLETLELRPRTPWDGGMCENWRAGERAAAQGLASFCEDGLSAYAEHRDRPDLVGTTRLSPHLHFGEISPRQIAAVVQQHVHSSSGPGRVRGAEVLLRELGWREFAHHALYHFPHTTDAPMDARFERFPWREGGGDLLEAWQGGRTGIPLVDAGMRELWRTGWMHNRVRMITASFLVKNCRIPWQQGARWFWDTLVDADLASNSLNWQWVAGSGADAAPFFRIFNPVRQGEKFDPHGEYVRRWVPEIGALPDRWIHQPWRAPRQVLDDCGLNIGRDYPPPVVDLDQSRKDALAIYRAAVAAKG